MRGLSTLEGFKKEKGLRHLGRTERKRAEILKNRYLRSKILLVLIFKVEIFIKNLLFLELLPFFSIFLCF